MQAARIAGRGRDAIRRIGLRELRLGSGLVVALFVLMHLLNHALGLISIKAMEGGLDYFTAFWSNRPAQVLLYGSFLLHFALSLLTLYRRRTLRMPMRELLQIVLGLSIPFLLIAHVVAQRIEPSMTGIYPGYPQVVQNLWVLDPISGAKQAIALIVVWLHACIGIHYWLRAKAGFGQYALYLYTAAVLIPVLSLLGFAAAGREIADGLYAVKPIAHPIPETTERIRLGLYAAFTAAILAVLLLRLLTHWRAWLGRVRISYPNGRIVAVPQGFSVLEASRLAGLPHQAVCGGRGRCSTCRVMVTDGIDELPPPSQQERATLRRIQATHNVRLACQLRPRHDITVVPALLGTGGAGATQIDGGGGQEREVAVLFCDLRGFTQMSETRLPFDTVFLLNRYFEMVGQAVERSGGHLDKFIGDGALALFGLGTPPRQGARQAIAAAIAIAAGLDELNRQFATEFGRPLRLAMSLHAGSAIVGSMGYGHATGLTAVGDTINVASRLEALAKERNAELVLSVTLADYAAIDFSGHERHTIAIRGRSAALDAWIFAHAREAAVATSASPPKALANA